MEQVDNKQNLGIKSYWAWAGSIIGPVDSKTEADASSSNTPVLVFKYKKKESIKDRFSSFRFLEADKDKTNTSKFKVVLIQEGMGNFKDAFYYTKEALASGVQTFEGKKIYADHPDKFEEQTRPERSVRDVLGHFEDLSLKEMNGRACLVGNLIIPSGQSFDWARDLMAHAVEYSKKYKDSEFIGLSINASGDANSMSIERLIEKGVPESAMEKLKKALAEGVDAVKVVTVLSDAVSCDLVTEAGAGGHIMEFLERNKAMETKHENEEKKKEALPEAPKADKADGGAHDDAAQDKELIKSMIAKHMGDGEHDEADIAAAHEAFEYFAKAGDKDHDGAAKSAVEAMRCAKHMASKHKQAGDQPDPSKLSAESEEKKSHESEEKKHESEEKKESSEKKEDEAKKESNAQLLGKIAFLEAKLKGIELKDAIDKKLAESKLPRSVTKVFRESLGEVKTAEEFNKLFGVFEKAYRAGSETGSNGILDLTLEKTTKLTESNYGGKAESVGFSDCVK